MAKFTLLRPIPPLYKLITFIALSLALFVAEQRGREVGQSLMLTAVYPLQELSRIPTQLWANLEDFFRTRQTLEAENAILKEELNSLRPRLLQLLALEQENKRLLKLLGSTEQLDGRMLVGRVIGAAHDAGRQILTLDRGERDGVFAGQPVIAAEGVVGQVFRVGLLSSQVLLITDREHGLPAQILRNRSRIILSGTGKPGHLVVPYQSLNSDVRKGDIVLTSGMGGRFPKGLPIGQVAEVSKKDKGYLDIQVTPWVRMDRIEEVLLLWPEL